MNVWNFSRGVYLVFSAMDPEESTNFIELTPVMLSSGGGERTDVKVPVSAQLMPTLTILHCQKQLQALLIRAIQSVH